MKRMKTIASLLVAVIVALTFVQCNNVAKQPLQVVYSSDVANVQQTVKIAYVDIDTLLSNYELWKELNEEMLRKEENIRATLNEKAKALQSDFEDFDRKLNNNGFTTRERAEAEQNRILKKREELEALQERLSNELAIENNKNSMLFLDSINSYINYYNKQKGYNVILSRIGDNILYIDSEMNITHDIIKGLNDRYYRNKK